MSSSMRFALLSGLMLLVALAGPSPAGAQSCSVPSGSYPTIQAAIDDPSCAQVLLAAQTFSESVSISRDVTVDGDSSSTTVIEGQVTVSGGTVVLQDMRIDTSTPELAGLFSEGLAVSGGAQVSGSDLVVRNASMLFGDGFESGDTTLWSRTVP
ncbi:MAG: hypothetical protein DRJ50_10490 [Actinobacteria bacterium]|nr:MAG: hypothetical protein DRJ50_10490 [Actinomycetota bacterium]